MGLVCPRLHEYDCMQSRLRMGANGSLIVNVFLLTDFVIDFEAPEYTVSEDGGSVSLCLETSTGNVEPVTVVFSSRHVTTSGILSKTSSTSLRSQGYFCRW